MLLLPGKRMGKRKTGRPRKDEGDAGTKQIRVFVDLGEMIADLADVLPKTTAQLCDPLLRPEVERLHAKYLPQIEAVRAARLAAEEAIRKAKEEAEEIEERGPTKRPRSGS